MIEEGKPLENYDSSGIDSSDISEERGSEPLATPAELDVEGTPEDSMPDPLAESNAVSSTSGEADPLEEMLEESAEAAIAQLADEVESLRTQLEERNSQYMRIAADFDNFRKRTQKEKEELEQQVKRNTLSELLPVVDSFERARSQIRPQTEAEAAIHKSYQGVYKQLVDCLKRIGVAPMRPEGKTFDPNLHEAVLREQTAEHPEGTVLEELVRGYLLGDRVLRHAMVKVAAAPEPSIVSDETSQGNPG
jgi:molecular chaperone GrpE